MLRHPRSFSSRTVSHTYDLPRYHFTSVPVYQLHAGQLEKVFRIRPLGPIHRSNSTEKTAARRFPSTAVQFFTMRRIRAWSSFISSPYASALAAAPWALVMLMGPCPAMILPILREATVCVTWSCECFVDGCRCDGLSFAHSSTPAAPYAILVGDFRAPLLQICGLVSF